MQVRILAVLVLLSLVFHRDAEACDCTIAPTDQSLLDKSAAIFVGRVTRSTGRGSYEVEVLATWRGVDAGALVTVRTEASSCGFRLAPGSTMLFFTNGKMEAKQCALDQDVRLPTAKALAFLGRPKAEVSDKVLARCACGSAPRKGKKPDVEFQAGTPVADGRYLVSIPLTAKPRPDHRNTPRPTTIISPSGGCQLSVPATTFWFANPTFAETAYANRCVADQLLVR